MLAQTAPYVAPNPVTIAVICLCGLLYLWLLFKRAINGRFDLYHISMLTVVVLLPVCFVVFPRFTYRLTQSIGVAFPFVLLFAALFVSMFLYMHRITSELNRVTMRSRRLTQEIAILSSRLDAVSGPVPPAAPDPGADRSPITPA